MDSKIIVLQSDFTYKEGAVASMHGVIKSVDATIEITDATHEIPKFDIWSASYRLMQYVRFWPKGTVFVSVVDPMVGTSRRASLAITGDGYIILSPDNGSFHHIKKTGGIASIYEIDIDRHRLRGYGTDAVSVFHGRDVFAHTAALIASGKIRYSDAGSAYPADEIVGFSEPEPYMEDGRVHGFIEISDPNFGNLWTNIPIGLFREAGFGCHDLLNVEITYKGETVFNDRVPFEASFGFVERGHPVIYQNEMMKAAFGIFMGNAAEEYSIGYGTEWEVDFRHE